MERKILQLAEWALNGLLFAPPAELTGFGSVFGTLFSQNDSRLGD
jgi:hypothetical protein